MGPPRARRRAGRAVPHRDPPPPGSPHLTVVLRAGPVVLREWREDDAPAIAPVCGDPAVCEHTTVPWRYTEEEALAWVRRQHARRADHSGIVLAVVRPGDDVPVGNVNLVRFSEDRRSAALGYWLVPAARDRGYATAAARALCELGFRLLGLERIELLVAPDNAASRGVAERIGARRDGERDGFEVWALTARRSRPPGSP